MLTQASKLRFYNFPGTRAEFQRQIEKSQVLRCLWENMSLLEGQDKINNPITLPPAIELKDQIFKDVSKNSDKKGALLSISQWYSFAKSLIIFYKNGVQNTWNSGKSYRKIKRSYKITSITNRRGSVIETKILSFMPLTFEMSQLLYMDKIENIAMNDSLRGDIVRSSHSEEEFTENLFSMDRKEYQTLKRVPLNLLKLPSFALIFLIFMEATPLLCYVFPEVTPSACVLPKLLPRIWNAKAIKSSSERAKSLSQDEMYTVASQNAYSLSTSDVQTLVSALKLKTKFLPTFLYPLSVLRKRLQNHFNYLRVDNYYLCGLNDKLGGNIWNLSNDELILACLERNLIVDLKLDVKELLETSLDQREQAEMEYYTWLRLRLCQHIIDFENFNIGYLIAQKALPQFEHFNDKIISWRNSI